MTSGRISDAERAEWGAATVVVPPANPVADAEQDFVLRVEQNGYLIGEAPGS